MLDPEGRVSSWNLGAQRIKGYLPSEVIGQHYSMFFGEEDREKGEPQRALDIALRDGRFENQGWRVRKDGSRFWANVVIDVIRDERGVLLGFAKITRDITDAVAAQRALEEAREAVFQSQKMESIGRLTARAAEPFFTTKGIGKGTGLGLSMVQGLAEQSGGRLILKSKKGSGTTVELWLPMADVSELSVKTRVLKPSQPSTMDLFRILVVDDDPLVLLSAVAMLEDLGHTVLYADSGTRALEIISEDDTIDLVITDQAMPHMTGIQLAETIKSRWPKLPALLALLATGYAEQMEIAVSWPRLSKPFSQELLLRAVIDAMA